MNTQSSSQELKIIDRSILSLSGVTKIISFDNSEFIIETNMETVHIKGEDMELLSLDLIDGFIKIKGKINGFEYISKVAKKSGESIIAKLFK